MDGWKMSFLFGRLIFRGELLVSGRVVIWGCDFVYFVFTFWRLGSFLINWFPSDLLRQGGLENKSLVLQTFGRPKGVENCCRLPGPPRFRSHEIRKGFQVPKIEDFFTYISCMMLYVKRLMSGKTHPKNILRRFSTSILGTWNFWWWNPGFKEGNSTEKGKKHECVSVYPCVHLVRQKGLVWEVLGASSTAIYLVIYKIFWKRIILGCFPSHDASENQETSQYCTMSDKERIPPNFPVSCFFCLENIRYIVLVIHPPMSCEVDYKGSVSLYPPPKKKTTRRNLRKSNKDSCMHMMFFARWWFQRFLFSRLRGRMINFDLYFSDGLKPPTSLSYQIYWKYFVLNTSFSKRIQVSKEAANGMQHQNRYPRLWPG